MLCVCGDVIYLQKRVKSQDGFMWKWHWRKYKWFVSIGTTFAVMYAMMMYLIVLKRSGGGGGKGEG